MEIGGRVYRKDLIILPDGSIHHPWWRTSGHVLTVADIGLVLAASPKRLIVGTGKPGLMRPDANFATILEGRGIQLTVLPTADAVEQFNQLDREAEACAACFHLTC